MSDLFLKIVNMSISATWLVGAVILLRLMLKKAPKWVNVLLWGMVAVRLICPFTLESALSLIPSAEAISPEIMTDPSPAIDSGVGVIDDAVNSVVSESFTPNPADSANPLQILIPILSWVWLTGVAAMGLYTFVSYWHIRQKVKMAIRVKPDIYLSEYVDSPFVLGVFRPRIYMPYHMVETDRNYVIAHERIHIRRKDHWWKPFGFALLTVHWFNPVMWVAYLLLCRDIELACDERVIREMEPEQRADYSQALLNCSVHRKAIAACPLAFGEVGVTERVKNVLSYKKPGFWVVVIALILCMVVAVCFLTDPSGNIVENVIQENGYRILWEMVPEQFDLVLHKFDYSAEELVNRKTDLGMFAALYYVTPGSHIHLKDACFAGDAQENLQLTFTIDYKEQQQKNRILLPYTLTDEGYQYTLSLLSGDVTDENGNIFQDACYLSGFGPSEEFTITVKTEVWDQAEENICFPLDGFRVLFYQKEGMFSDKTPYPITRNLAFYRSQINTAQLSIWREEPQHLSLTQTDIIPLLDALYHLAPEDFEKDIPIESRASLTLSTGDENNRREMLLSTDGEYVQFTFDSDTAEALDGGVWSVKDDALNAFFAELLPLPDGAQWGVGLEVESASHTGATVVFRSTEVGQIFTGSHFVLQKLTNGEWVDIPTLQDAIFTSEAISIANVRRFTIDWEWLYGKLPAGHYRIGKHIRKDGNVGLSGGSPDSELAVVYGEFSLTEPLETPYAATHTFSNENAEASADFLTDGGGYNFFSKETKELAGILNTLEEKDFFSSPGVEAKTVIHVWNEETAIDLYSDGEMVEFVMEGAEKRWAVADNRLNAFFREINKHSQAQSTYEIYNVAPLNELGEHYTIEEAANDQVVVMVDGDVRHNQEVWRAFVTDARRGKEALVRCMQYDSQTGTSRIYDIQYDRTEYLYRCILSGEVQTGLFPYLEQFSGVLPEGQEADWYDYFFLCDEENGLWSTQQNAPVSRETGVHIPSIMVYQDVSVVADSANP